MPTKVSIPQAGLDILKVEALLGESGGLLVSIPQAGLDILKVRLRNSLIIKAQKGALREPPFLPPSEVQKRINGKVEHLIV